MENEEKFLNFFNNAPLGYQSLDFNGIFIEVNQAWLDTLGYNRDEVIGKWFGDFLTPAYQDGFRKRFPVFKAQGKIHSEFEMIHKNGDILFIAFDGRVGYDLKGNFKQTHCILKDISDQRNAEVNLRESEERWRTLVQTIPDFIALQDCDGRYIFLNHYAEGFSQADIVGRENSEFVSEESRNDFKKAFKECVTLRKRMEIEYTAFGNNKELRKYESVFVPLVENGDVTMVLAVARDITEKDLAESIIKNKAEELERFNNLMVGRELKMIELKKEINELLKNSGKREKYKINK